MSVDGATAGATGPGGTANTTATPSFDGSARYVALDAVRGIAILLVVGYHAAFRFPPAPWDPVAGFLHSVGWIGVDMFFALSGFLIATILQRDAARGDIGGFFRRRFFRIVPIFTVAIATFVFATVVLGHERELLGNVWMPALLLNGWMIPWYGEAVPFTITWSLSVEEFAYLLLGLAGWYSPAALRRMVFAFLAVALAVRLAVLATGAFEPIHLYFFVPARLDAIAFGALGAFGAYAPVLRRPRATAAAGVATFALMVAFQHAPPGGTLMPAVGYAAFGLVCAAWVAGLAAHPSARPPWPVRVLAAIGKLSYFIYLFHLFFLEAVRMLQRVLPEGGLSYWPAVVLATASCYAAASVSWRFFEAPLIRRAHGPRPAQ